ncbi:Methyltransferase-like protein 7B [Coelomomyces lativittatus]|nr:Methyltransferase-like protein 7B [Coelomomyces lativittatus]KAJ1515498.1 Methyltransferase-like protein 7B [Coelomomyces lativittatus]KAJ1517277.1 Methyltransferase-like protein 7B [Coelomomyces lativittatus]
MSQFANSWSNFYAANKKHRPLWISGALVYGISTSMAFIYLKFFKNKEEFNTLTPPFHNTEKLSNFDPAAKKMSPQSTTAIYDIIAKDYDKELYWDEWRMGMLLLRRWLISKAKGDVLEIAAGTGRNLPYYSIGKVRTLSFLDTSSAMLSQLHSKPCLIPFRSYLSEAERLPFPSQAFDSVISTFSLCSVEDPVITLVEAVRVLKPGGSMYLLEHGVSKYTWLNSWINKDAPLHAAKFGCWYNRNIQTMVDQLQDHVKENDPNTELDISIRRFHFGTTWMIILTKLENEKSISNHPEEIKSLSGYKEKEH